MKISVMGAGGVGGYFGARLAAAGNDVSFVARGAHLEAMRERGLAVRSPLGDAHVRRVDASDDPAAIGPVDVVLFATKLYDTDAASELCRPLVGPDTVVVSFQNGVDGIAILRRALGERHVAGGVARISAAIAEPGVIGHYSGFAGITFGELDGIHSERLEAFHAVASAAGIDAHLADDIEAQMWEKFILLAPFSALTSLTRLPIGPILAEPRSRRLLQAAVGEVDAVARARGIGVRDDAAAKALAFMERMPASMKASMLMDLERGHRLELEWLAGAVCRNGAELGVATPVHDMALAALSPYADGTPQIPQP